MKILLQGRVYSSSCQQLQGFLLWQRTDLAQDTSFQGSPCNTVQQGGRPDGTVDSSDRRVLSRAAHGVGRAWSGLLRSLISPSPQSCLLPLPSTRADP